MIVPDTSAWIEYLRGSPHPARGTIDSLIDADVEIALTECVLMEILAGARDQQDAEALQATFSPFPILHLNGQKDFEEAARIYRMCRWSGHTFKNQIDCLIAVPVIKADAQLLHNDSDFEVIARHCDLQIYGSSS